MKTFPSAPFLTEDFSATGGGIDFLGLRWVGLTIVGEFLIPELNNVTTDMGTFFLGAWIPWKFRQLCSGEAEYTERNYREFREKVEVALSLTLRKESGLSREDGEIRNKIGNTQRCALPAKLTFKNAKRNSTNSLYAAAIYGPSLRALGFIQTNLSQAVNGKPGLNIPVVSREADTVEILKEVDGAMAKAPNYALLASLESPDFTWPDVKQLGENGLDPSFYRGRGFSRAKNKFLQRLLPRNPQDPGFGRTLSANLLLRTLKLEVDLSVWGVRDVWYTGQSYEGQVLNVTQGLVNDQLLRWSCFMARQHQRYAIETFLRCFENALKDGVRSIDEVVDYWMKKSAKEQSALELNFGELMKRVAGSFWDKDDLVTSRRWNEKVHGEHEQFEYVHEPQGDSAVYHGLSMLAGWYWRMIGRSGDSHRDKLMDLGGSDRMGMNWFLSWLRSRRDLAIDEFLKEIFSDLVFSQHMRVALARFDGRSQRLRFLLCDQGIEPTNKLKDLGNLYLPWMPDRLDTLISLLCDCDVVVVDGDVLRHGSAASQVSL